ncbi:MAG: hypothetical protein HY246_00410 [Proteobacteria bacterium]|nr:hypothetical protein [Pseudomonadota bacterium]
MAAEGATVAVGAKTAVDRIVAKTSELDVEWAFGVLSNGVTVAPPEAIVSLVCLFEPVRRIQIRARGGHRPDAASVRLPIICHDHDWALAIRRLRPSALTVFAGFTRHRCDDVDAGTTTIRPFSFLDPGDVFPVRLRFDEFAEDDADPDVAADDIAWARVDCAPPVDPEKKTSQSSVSAKLISAAAGVCHTLADDLVAAHLARHPLRFHHGMSRRSSRCS